jgi:hypothetical protein
VPQDSPLPAARIPARDASGGRRGPLDLAIGAGELFALVLSTALSLTAAIAVSGELRLLLGALGGARLSSAPVLWGWCAAAVTLGAVPLALGARSIGRSDLSVG